MDTNSNSELVIPEGPFQLRAFHDCVPWENCPLGKDSLVFPEIPVVWECERETLSESMTQLLLDGSGLILTLH